MPKIQNTTTSSADGGEEQQEHSSIADTNAKWYSHFGRQFGIFLQT